VAGNLPGATPARQQIAIGANNVVTVTICWQKPGETIPHNYVGMAQING
jgi:type IV pilus assembly protein PilV